MRQHSSKGVGVVCAGPSPVVARLQSVAPTVKGIGWLSSVPGLDKAEETLRQRHADVLVLSVRPPGLEEYRQVHQLRQRVPLPPILVVCSGQTEQVALAALSMGAAECVNEMASPRSILGIIQSLARGEHNGHGRLASSHSLGESVVQALQSLPPLDGQPPARCPLSRREVEVLQLVARGCSNREVAGTLYIQEQTVKNHVSSILSKLGARNRAMAAALALRNRWLPLK